jgi:O-antigen/teichoic acid export membrane protein
MRRIVALLPAAVITVMFPRVVKALARGESPNHVISLTALIILGVSGLLSVLYFLFNDQLITLIFGRSYAAAIPFLGWMAVAMLGVSLSSIWLNYYLAEKPRNFVILLASAVALEWILLNIFPPSLQSAVLAFGITGWLLSIAGLFLYIFKIGRLPRRGASPAISHTCPGGPCQG